MRALIILFLLLLSSCAPMPGPGLLQGAKGPTPLEHVDVYITKDFWATQRFCLGAIPAHQVLLTCLLNACVQIACANIHVDKITGRVHTCYIFAAFDWDEIIQHELKHCEGYDDPLY